MIIKARDLIGKALGNTGEGLYKFGLFLCNRAGWWDAGTDKIASRKASGERS